MKGSFTTRKGALYCIVMTCLCSLLATGCASKYGAQMTDVHYLSLIHICLDLVQIDWDGNVVWKFDRNEYIEDPGIPGRWMARSHHDYQREGSTTGYYAPGMEPKTDSGNTLVLAHRNARNPKISDKQLLDDVILEVDWDGDIVWEWNCHEHFDEMGFREGPKNTLARNPNYRPCLLYTSHKKKGPNSYRVRPLSCQSGWFP